MALKDDIIAKVDSILDTKFETEDVSYIPDLDDTKLTFGNKGLKFYATVLYIDMRGSTKLLNSHNNNVVAKIFMAYYHTILKIAKSTSGEVRSFNGDSLLVFYYGNTKEAIQTATKAAMNMKYMLSVKSNPENNLFIFNVEIFSEIALCLFKDRQINAIIDNSYVFIRQVRLFEKIFKPT